VRNPFAKPARIAPPEETVEAARARRLVEIGKEIQRQRAEHEWLDTQLMQLRFKFKTPSGGFVGSTTEDAAEHRAQEFRLLRAQDHIRFKLNGLLAEYSILADYSGEAAHREGKLIHGT
jgi:hypothetical protein